VTFTARRYLLDKLQQLVGLLESLEELVDLDHFQHVLVQHGRLHDVTPVLVHSCEPEGQGSKCLSLTINYV